MKKTFGLAITATILAVAYYGWYPRDPRLEYEDYLRSHPYHIHLTKGYTKAERKARPDRPDLAFMQEFLRTMDPVLKRPRPELLIDENIRTARLRDGGREFQSGRTKATSLADGTQWEERGPSTVGGRTRAMLFDPADPQHKKVWAGGVSGGLWYIDDITSASSSWTKVDDFWDNLSISCMTADPNNNQIMYVGTGEAHQGMRGGGIWKTIDGGDSWVPLASTSNFLHVRDIEVRDENGTSVIYAAVNRDFDFDNPPNNAGLYRSANGGQNWTQVLPNAEFSVPHSPTDIEIGDDEIWVGAKPTFSGGSVGSILYRSTLGTQGSWTAVQSFTINGQIEIGIAPSNADIVYAILEDNLAVEAIVRTVDGGNNWSTRSIPVDADMGIPADDFTRGQAWYDLTIAIHPTNPNEVIVGGIDLFKTTNGGTSWTQLSKWWPGIQVTAPVVHADQHEILYRPEAPNDVIFGNDGGVYYGTGIGTASPSINARNNNYNVTQFYTAAIHPTLTNYMLGGTQDNGTRKFTQAGFGVASEAFGGDGAMCFIDQDNPQIQIVSYVFNNIYRSTNGGNSFSALVEDNSTGNFINVGEYDKNLKILYTSKTETDLYRITNIDTSPAVESLVINLGSMATAMRLSPYVEDASNLYVGTAAGRVFRIKDAQDDDRIIEEITGPAFSTGSVSSISFGASEDQILVTFFNYGVVNVWETRDGGNTWTDREGNLPNMPVRWVEYHPHNPDQAYLATQLGVWSTDNINVAEPDWKPTNGGLANVRTDMLRFRKSDGIMMAATHGRGVFTALVPSQLEQDITFNTINNKTFGDGPFTLQASSTSQLEVRFESSDASIASVQGKIVTINGAGTVTITALQDGNTYYAPADPVDQVLTVNRAAQTINFAALPEKEIDDEPFDLTATATSGLAVSFTSSDPAVATVSGKTVTIQGIGTTTITASQAGNNNFLAASNIDQTLTVVSRIIELSGDLNFGEVIIGEAATRDLTIENSGTAPITVTGITYPEGYSGEVKTEDTKIVVTVTFKPTAAEDYPGEIVVQSNATSGDNSIEVSGTGIAITDVEEYMDKLIKLYPNPVTDWLTIAGANFIPVKSIKVTDESGRVQSRNVESATDREIRLKVADLPRGVYVIAVPAGSSTYYKKFLKQ